MCYGLVELMKLINPNLSKDPTDYNHKIWDHLFIIANFDLDVDSPYPIPEKSILERKPEKVDYNTNNLRFKHYGKNINLLAEEVAKIEDPKEKEEASIYLAKLMKKYFITWNRDTPDNEVIIKNMETISDKKLTLDLEHVNENRLLDVKVDIPSNNNNNNKGGGRNYKSNNKGKGSNQNYKRKKR